MKARWLLIAALSSCAFGQGVFYSSSATQAASNVPPGSASPVYTVPNALVTVCSYPATGDPCTNQVDIFTDQDLSPAHKITQPLHADQFGRYSFWVAPGIYSQSIQTQGGTSKGTYPLSLDSPPGPQGPGGIGCGSANCIVSNPTTSQTIVQPSGTSTFVNNLNKIVYAQSGDTLASLESSCGASPCQIVIAQPQTITLSANHTIPSTINLYFQNSGKWTVNGAFTLTVGSGIVQGPETQQIFAGTAAVNGLSFDRPEWFASTLLTAINALGADGTVQLGWGMYDSGDFGAGLSKSNFTIQGVKTPQANQAITSLTPATAFISGTGSIIRGNVSLIGSNLVISDLGVDVGNDSGLCSANSALQVTPNGINQPMLYNVLVRNVTTISCTNAASPGFHTHSLLFENVTGLTEENIITYNGLYGNVVKAINVSLTNITDALTYSSCGIVKSDDVFGNAAHVTVNGLNMYNCGQQFVLDTFGATLEDVTVTNIHAVGMVGGAIQGHIAADPDTGNPGKIDHIAISGGNIVNTSGNNAIEFQDGSFNVDISHLNLDGGTGINGIVIGTLGPSGSSVEDINISNYTAGASAGYGVYEFPSDGQASNIHCTAVETACVTSSGDGTHIGLLSVSNISSDGTLFHSFPNSSYRFADQGAWQTPTFANGWHNFGSPNQTAQYRVDRNLVYLSGLIVPGSGAQVTTLPAGYRPLASMRLVADGYNGSVYGACEVLVEANGNVSVVNYSACGSNYVSLDGLAFPVQ